MSGVSQKLIFETNNINSLFSLENYCSYTPTVSRIKYAGCELGYSNGSGDSNFLDLDWLSASDNERLFILPCFYLLYPYLCLSIYQAFYLMYSHTCNHTQNLWTKIQQLFYIYHRRIKFKNKISERSLQKLFIYHFICPFALLSLYTVCPWNCSLIRHNQNQYPGFFFIVSHYICVAEQIKSRKYSWCEWSNW